MYVRLSVDTLGTTRTSSRLFLDGSYFPFARGKNIFLELCVGVILQKKLKVWRICEKWCFGDLESKRVYRDVVKTTL